jgi:ankyrin repeat protein
MTFDEAQKLIKEGNLVSLRRELDGGASPNLSNQFSWSLLMIAALEGNTSIGDLLISRGATLDSKNDFGETALSLAAHKGYAPFIRTLLKNGASSDCRPHGNSLEEWLRVASDLSQEKIGEVMDLISDANRRN